MPCRQTVSNSTANPTSYDGRGGRRGCINPCHLLRFGELIRIIGVLLTVMLALGAESGVSHAAPSDETIAERVKTAVDDHIIPRLGALQSAMAELETAVNAHCNSPSASNQSDVRMHFGNAVEAWAAVEFLRFGPLVKDNRAQRISFWPDPRGIVRRQIRRLLAAKDPALSQEGALANQSVAVQGLTALQVLFRTTGVLAGAQAGEEDAAFACSLSGAIAANLTSIAKEVVADWSGTDGWRRRILSPGPSNEVYKNQIEAVSEIVRSLLTGFQIVRDREIVVLQAAAFADGKLSRLPYQRAGLAKRYLLAGVGSLCQLRSKLRLEEWAPADQPWIKGWLVQACRALINLSGDLEIPAKQEDLPGKLNKRQLRQLKFFANGMRQLVGRHIVPSAGLTIGFNELDGD